MSKYLQGNTTHPTRLVNWTIFCTVVNLEHTAILTITWKGSNIQYIQTITTFFMKVIIEPTICSPYVHLNVIKIMSPMVTITNLLLPNILINGVIRLSKL